MKNKNLNYEIMIMYFKKSLTGVAINIQYSTTIYPSNI